MKLFTMYVGLEHDREGSDLGEEATKLAIHLLKDKLAHTFGGYSVGEVQGGFIHSNGLLDEERALRVEVTARDEQMSEIHECASMFRDLFRQESILLNCTTIDSEFV